MGIFTLNNQEKNNESNNKEKKSMLKIMKKRRPLKLTIMAILLSMGITACAPQNNQSNNNYKPSNYKPTVIENYSEDYTPTQYPTIIPVEDGEYEEFKEEEKQSIVDQTTNNNGPKIDDFASLYGYGNDSNSTSDDSDKNKSNSENLPTDNDKKVEKFYQAYKQFLKSANDTNDSKWANDYDSNDIAKSTVILDSKAYESVFGYQKPTLDELKTAVNQNQNISQKYKNHMINFLTKWLAKYPDTDFTVLKHNLKTLVLKEVTSESMMWNALSPNAVACYRPNENEIYVNVNIDLSDEGNDDTIVFWHEFCHAARTTRTKINGYNVRTASYPEDNFGLYYDEAVMTYFVYQVQGRGNTSQFYKMASNYYRIIIECLGEGTFTGADYFNHQINYFAEKMDQYMGDTDYALHILSLIDVQMNTHYKKYMNFKITDFSELYDYITRMYLMKNLKPNASREEAETVFNQLMKELTTNLKNIKHDYPGIEEASFRPHFEKYCSEHGIGYKTR